MHIDQPAMPAGFNLNNALGKRVHQLRQVLPVPVQFRTALEPDWA